MLPLRLQIFCSCRRRYTQGFYKLCVAQMSVTYHHVTWCCCQWDVLGVSSLPSSRYHSVFTIHLSPWWKGRPAIFSLRPCPLCISSPVNFKRVTPTSSVVLPGLTPYLRSFMLCTGFLSDPAFSTKLFFSLFNHWTTKPLPISPMSSGCTFRLASFAHLPMLNSFFLSSAHLKSFGWCAFFFC